MSCEEKKSESTPPNGISSDKQDNNNEATNDENVRHDEASTLSENQMLAALETCVENHHPDQIRHHIGDINNDDVDDENHKYNPETVIKEPEIDSDKYSFSIYPILKKDVIDDGGDQFVSQSKDEDNNEVVIEQKSTPLTKEVENDEKEDGMKSPITKVASTRNLKDDRKYDAYCETNSLDPNEEISAKGTCIDDAIPLTKVASMRNFKDDSDDDDSIDTNIYNLGTNKIPKGNLKDDRKYSAHSYQKKKEDYVDGQTGEIHQNGPNNDKNSNSSRDDDKIPEDIINEHARTGRKDYGVKRDDEYDEEETENSNFYQPGAYQVYHEDIEDDYQFEIQIPHATEVQTEDIESENHYSYPINENHENSNDHSSQTYDSDDRDTNIQILEFRESVNSAPLVEAVPYYVSSKKTEKLYGIRKFWSRVILFGSIFALAAGLTISLMLLTFKSPPNETQYHRFNMIREILRDSLQDHYNHVDMFNDRSSVEYKALLWIVRDDVLQISPNNPSRLLQRFILTCLYYSTKGDISWKNQYNFLTSTHECSWNKNASHVLVDYENRGIWCKGYTENITHIWLDTNNLTGSLPNAISALSNLQWLHMKTNGLTSTIPESIGALVHLQGMVMNANQLTGTIPQSIGKLTNLQLLTLGVNQLTGSIPLSMNELTNLQNLELHFNRLTSTLRLDPSKFNRIKMLMLNENDLTGEFISSIGNGFEDLELLFVGSNQLNGTIPSSIGNLSKLTFIDLSNNTLSGNVPQQIWDLKEMIILGLGMNNLVGSIPTNIGNLSQLKVFSIENNNMHGLLPSVMGNLHELNLLSIYSNHFTGSLPSSIGNIRELKAMQIGDNFFNGTLPESMLNNRNLEFLSFPRTKISGNAEFLCDERKKMPTFFANCDPHNGVSCSCCVCCSQDNINDCSQERVYVHPALFTIFLYSTGGWNLPHHIDPVHDLPHL